MQNKTSNPSDMLATLEAFGTGLELERAQVLPSEDRDYCELLQQQCYRVLERIQRLYGKLREEVESLTEYDLTFLETGEVKARLHTDQNPRTVFSRFEELPIEMLNSIVGKYKYVCLEYCEKVMQHFRKKYQINSTYKEEPAQIKMGHRPSYATYVDFLVSGLDGKSFREKAEEEIICGAMTVACRGRKQPLCKGDIIQFFNITYMDSFYRGLGRNAFSYSQSVAKLCAGLALFAEDSIEGDERYISGLDTNNVEVGKWYDLPSDKLSGIKFYLNGRIDVRFASAAHAAACYRFLRLYSLGC